MRGLLLIFDEQTAVSWGYVYEGTGVYLLRLPGPVLEIGTLFHALTRVKSRVLSHKARRDEGNECMSPPVRGECLDINKLFGRV